MSDTEKRFLPREFDIVRTWGHGLSVEKSLVDELLAARHARLEALERIKEVSKKLLAVSVRPFFELNHRLLAAGMMPARHALLLGTKQNALMQIQFTFRPVKLDKIKDGGFEGLVEKGYLEEWIFLSLNDRLIPQDKRPLLLSKLRELMKECGIDEDAVISSSGYVPSMFFRVERYRLLSLEQNLKLQEVLPADFDFR